MDYQEAKQPEPINLIALFDLDHVDVDRVSNLYNVKQSALWPPMDRLAMKHNFLAQKVSLVEWLYSAPVKECVCTYPKTMIWLMIYCYCVQVQKVWRTLIIHCLVPNCGIPGFPLVKSGKDDNDADYEIWFRNTHHAGMVRHFMHHALEAWDDFLPEFKGITNPTSKERDMQKYVEIFCQLGSALCAEFVN